MSTQRNTQSSTTVFHTETDILLLRNELLKDGVLSIQDQIDISETHIESIKEQIRQGLNVATNKKKEIELQERLREAPSRELFGVLNVEMPGQVQ